MQFPFDFSIVFSNRFYREFIICIRGSIDYERVNSFRLRINRLETSLSHSLSLNESEDKSDVRSNVRAKIVLKSHSEILHRVAHVNVIKSIYRYLSVNTYRFFFFICEFNDKNCDVDRN